MAIISVRIIFRRFGSLSTTFKSLMGFKYCIFQFHSFIVLGCFFLKGLNDPSV